MSPLFTRIWAALTRSWPALGICWYLSTGTKNVEFVKKNILLIYDKCFFYLLGTKLISRFSNPFAEIFGAASCSQSGHCDTALGQSHRKGRAGRILESTWEWFVNLSLLYDWHRSAVQVLKSITGYRLSLCRYYMTSYQLFTFFQNRLLQCYLIVFKF